VCELRRAHPRWGARRTSHELGRRGVTPTPSRSTVHRVLVRNHLVRPQAQQHPRHLKRWQREAPMQLWQLDLLGGVFLADGRECKLLTGLDDHSRLVVIATVLARPTGRGVCEAFATALGRYGVPSEALTDNGKQFIGRFTKPRPAEVLFEQLCRENAVTQLLLRGASPAGSPPAAPALPRADGRIRPPADTAVEVDRLVWRDGVVRLASRDYKSWLGFNAAPTCENGCSRPNIIP
jgi:hypothetical protein